MKAPVRRLSLVSLLRQQLTGRLHLGVLQPGDRLQSLRVAAAEFGVDPRVVLAAYRDLESEGLVELRERSGVFVAKDYANGADGDTAGRAPNRRRMEWLIDRLAESLAIGIPATRLVEDIRGGMETLRLRAVALDRNGDQLWSTADELRRDYGFDVNAVDVEQLRQGDELPASIRRADLLVTASPAGRMRAIAKAAEVPLLEVSMCPDLFAEVRRLLRSEPVYFVVTDSRFAKKLQSFLPPSRGSSRLRTLVYRVDDLGQIPPAAPVYLTRLTRELMQREENARAVAQGISSAVPSGPASPVEQSLLNRVMPDARVFSAQSARELLSFVVHANTAASERASVGASIHSVATRARSTSMR